MTAPTETAHHDLYGLDLESRQMVIETIQQLKTRLLSADKILAYDKDEIFPEETIRQMLGPEIGLQLLFIPEQYGGMGGGARDCCEVTREMAKICLGVGTAFFAIQLGADPIIVGGTEEQKIKWLGAIAEGQSLVAYAVTEPEAGSNLAALKTKAEPIVDGQGQTTGYKINGTKQFISTGGFADFITLLAVTPQGPTFFIVEKGTPGFEQGKGEEKHGIRASNTSPLSFSDVVVPVDNIVGGIPGEGLKQANKVFGYTRVMVAAMALGAAEAALDIAIPYARERIQFGGPLAEKQGYTHKLIVPHVVRLEAAGAYIEEVAERLDSGEQDLQVEGSIAKLFTTEAANLTADNAMQALGGYGYITEFQIEKIKRDVRITSIYEGTSEIQQNIISTMRWKKTWKTKGSFYADLGLEMAALAQTDPEIGSRAYGLAAIALNEMIMLAHKNRLTRQQYVMFALADLMTHVEVGVSLARKAAGLQDQRTDAAQKTRIAARLFASEVAALVADRALKILLGSGAFEKDQVQAFLQKIKYDDLAYSCNNLIIDMDRLAALLFARAS